LQTQQDPRAQFAEPPASEEVIVSGDKLAMAAVSNVFPRLTFAILIGKVIELYLC
jgi:hypothetical protein